MKAWQEFIAREEQELGREVVAKWLRPLKILRFDACNLYLEARDSFQALWFEEHIRPKVLSSLYNNNHKLIAVHLSIVEELQMHAKRRMRSKEIVPKTAALNFNSLDAECRFDNFVVATANEVPYRLLSTLSRTTIGGEFSFNPIYVYGHGGVGKTHLLMATAQQLKREGLNVIYATAQTFTEHVVGAIRSGEMNTVRQVYRHADVLVLDDVHHFGRKTTTQEEFFHTFNTLHLADKQLILSANSLPQLLQNIEPRLISRFEWGLALPIEPLSVDELVQMLHDKAQSLRYTLPPRLVEFLLNHFGNSTKSLLRALHALVLRSHTEKHFIGSESTPPSIAQAKALLHDLISAEQKLALTPQKLVQHVAEHFGILSKDVLGRSQSRDCVLPRQLAMYLCRYELKMTFKAIGDLFGRDHSTVMSSVKIIESGAEVGDSDIGVGLLAVRQIIKESPTVR